MREKTAAAILCIVLFLGATPGAAGDTRDRYLLKSQFTFENRGEEGYTLTEEDTELPLFLENRWQSMKIKDSSHSILMGRFDEDGNPVAIIEVPQEIPAGETLVFWVEYLIESEVMERPEFNMVEAGNIEDIPLEIVRKYTSETETFSRDVEVVTLASELSVNSTSVLETVTYLLGWVVSSVDYCNFEVPRYPEETLEDLEGDCDDQAILLISMLRSLGIPAFLQIGVLFSDTLSSSRSSWDGHLSFKQEGVGWHGWAMVYIPPWGWVPIDLTLTKKSDPIEMIREAPEYSKNIVVAFNVSRQPYIAESHLSRETLTQSDLYVIVSDTVIEDRIKTYGQTAIYIAMGLAAGIVIVGVVFLLYKRRSKPLTSTVE
ncbi:MAG: transglutaminase domain-containing protein [Candidatus Bathyarchaeota archaeon]